MITAELKPVGEILKYVEPFGKILLVGCNDCVTVCHAGGRKEVAVLASLLRMARLKEGSVLTVDELTLERQCDPEYLEELASGIDKYDAICSMACGCGVQSMAERYKGIPVFPMVNTEFMGSSERHGRLGRALRRLRRLCFGPNRRHLSRGALLKTHIQRTLRRIDQGQVRDQP